ncbi:MAG: hypothetical protein V2A34_04425 [Lentisphaerota bacterium]
MTKSISRIIVIGAVCLIGASAGAQNLTRDYTISVRVAAGPVDLDGVNDPVSFGAGEFGATLLSNLPQGQPRSTVNNRGSAMVDYTVAASITSGGWTLGSTPGANVAVLYGIFTQALTEMDDADAGRDVASADFGAEDRLSATATRASNTVLSRDAETNPEARGNNVYPSQPTRSVRYRLDLPTSGDTSEQVITVTLGAVVVS